MIISASRRTDIPAFYSEWMENRLKAGYVLTRNPRNPHQISRISLTPEEVDGIVFWTKNPTPMLDRLSVLKDYSYYFQFTLTPYGKDVEPGLPDKTRVMIPVFQELASRAGKERVIWRYDPIFFSRAHTPEWHLQRFHEMAARLSGYTEECVISFLDYYRNTEKQMQGLGLTELPSEEKAVFLRKLAQAAAGYGLRLKACAEDPAWTPTEPPARSSSVFTSESPRTTTTCAFLTYGAEKAITLSLSGVTVKPFQIQSMLPVASSCSFAFQSIGWGTSSTPRRFATSLAASISKPTISPFSSLKPIGGKESSSPRMNVPLSCTS